MWQSLTRISVITLGLTLTVLPLQAAIIGYDFSVTPDSGPLVGNTYSGSFSYDDASLTGVGEEFLPESAITGLEFDFEGTIYTLSEAQSVGVQFLDGIFLGLSYVTDVAFSLEPGIFRLSEAEFSYDLPQGVGFGNLSYQPQDEVIPEPSFLLATLGLGLISLTRRVKA